MLSLDQLLTNEVEPCPHCESAKAKPHLGTYAVSCVTCCARLVIDMPDRNRVYSAYSLFRGRNHTPSKERIEAEVIRLLALKEIG